MSVARSFVLAALCASASGFALSPAVPPRAAARASAAPISMAERTYIMIKPDGVQRGLVGKIIERFEQRGYKLTALELQTPTKERLESHYEDLKTKKFFPGLIEYMSSGPVCCMVWEGLDAVRTGRKMLGET